MPLPALVPSQLRSLIVLAACGSIVVEMDRGRCFQSDLNVRDRFGQATVLMYNGVASYGKLFDGSGRGAKSVRSYLAACCYCKGRDVVIPPLVSVGRHMAQPQPRALAEAFLSARPRHSFWERRRVLASFRGDPNQSDWRQPNVRRLLLRHFSASGMARGVAARGDGTPRELRISTVEAKSKRGSITHAEYLSELLDSIFCLCPLGWAHWSSRFFEAIQTGCLPVVFPRDDNMLPFARFIDYASFVVSVPPTSVASLQTILHAIADDQRGLRRRQRALWQHRSKLDWTDIGAGGAFHTLWTELAVRKSLRL